MGWSSLARWALPPLLAVLVGLAVPAGTARAEIARLLAPADLAPLVQAGAVVVLDVRDDRPVDGTSPYVAGHIPGAIPVPYAKWRGPADNPGALPDTAALQALVRDAGVDGAKPVVVAHAGADATDFGTAAWVYWTLRMLGLDRLAVLNGGVAAWTRAGLPLSTEPVAATRSAFVAEPDPALVATREEIAGQLGAADGGQLLDARPEPYFLGKLWHDAAKRPGTIRGAESFTYARWFADGGPLIVGPEEARRIAAENGLDRASATVSFCNTGQWAAINWFALSELAGVPGVKLYPASMVDWSRTDLPMDNVPGRIEWLWLSTKKWVERTFG